MIQNNEERNRYEAMLGDQLAGHIDYRLGGQAIDLIHTEVSAKHEGKGLASQLAKFALDDVRSRGMKVIPSCSYIRSYIAKHPEYADLVTERQPR